ncbi:hypothetical protein BAUCODRAFT_573250 [Baudoinia panamericana UAMH 10762]|uniref:Uncharacterized protein n=1 Tax=Baudoinia panamericana (strain UAMH 10762) TaxID=717646 RepID=M2N4V3_BAUPA|nr:uncharacterized protein BAUCODRAFT_573250 [Baudoinia panamericana UAMH 10762]EMC98998.1 hypothetical protein BAUCODRAFT_573250 [Baudoinia panamericana UAMH 10762]
MISLRRICLLALPLLAFAQENPQDDRSELQKLLDGVPKEAIDAALREHLAPKYQDGVFEDAPRGIEALHHDDPELATQLVHVAVHEAAVRNHLQRKRQVSNVTAVITSPVVITDSSTTALSFTTETSTGQTTLGVAGASTTQSQSTAQGRLTPLKGCIHSTEHSSSCWQLSGIRGGSTTNGETTIAITTTNAAGSTVVSSQVAAVVAASTPSPVTTTNAAGSTIVSTPAAITAATVSAQASGSTLSGVLVPVVVSSTNSAGSVVVQTTSAFETSAPTSVTQAITTTNSQGSTFTTSTVVPAAVITETNSNGQTITTTSPLASVEVAPGGSIVTSAPAVGASSNADSSSSLSAITTTDQFGQSVVLSGSHQGQVITTTDAGGRTVVLTYTPGGGQVSQLVLRTTQLPNGQLSTITSYAVVGGAATITSTPSNAAARQTSSSSHGLQSGIAAPTGRYVGEVAAMVGGAIGMAAVLL